MNRVPYVRPEERVDAKTGLGALACIVMLVIFCFVAYGFVHYVAMPILHTVIERAIELRSFRL